MNYLWQVHLMYGIGLFVIGTVVGSFLNVCIYRIPWEKSVIWPGSHCSNCLSEIRAWDNVPVLAWLWLGGKCRNCRVPFSIRYPAIELMVGLMFAGVYLLDAVLPAYVKPAVYVRDDSILFAKVLFHVLLVSFLVVVTFIDADLTIVPASVTNLGTIFGLALGMMVPEVRPVDPTGAVTAWQGLWVGVNGVLVGGGLIVIVRVVGGFVFRREAMGSGDIYILAMIGAYLGWQAAILTFFLAPFFGFLPAIAKLVVYLGKRLRGRKYSSSDRELPFGPCLSLAALTLLFTWRWAWPGFAKYYFENISVLFLFLIGKDS